MTGSHNVLPFRETPPQRLERFVRLVDEELVMRQRVYPKQIVRGLMSQDRADAKIRGMAELRDFLQELLIAARKDAAP